MRDHDGLLSFAPRLPPGWTRLRFGMLWRKQRLRVDITPDEVGYELLEGEAMTLRHHGEELTVHPSPSVSRPIPPIITPVPVHQPHGRLPLVGRR
jgi:alpha,alpha-trehalose phosphorylase